MDKPIDVLTAEERQLVDFLTANPDYLDHTRIQLLAIVKRLAGEVAELAKEQPTGEAAPRCDCFCFGECDCSCACPSCAQSAQEKGK